MDVMLFVDKQKSIFIIIIEVIETSFANISGPESLTAYCRSLLTAGKFQFKCPYIDRTNGV